ncbi:hypothetical protein ACD109_004350 [Salmonella enterica]
MRILKLSLVVAILSGYSVNFSAVADTSPATSNAQSEGAFGANYGMFEYTDSDSLINSIRLLEKFGFNTSVVADTLDLNSYKGSVIIFKPVAGGKSLSYEDALAAFSKYMKPQQFSSSDAIVVKNTPLSVNEGGTVMKQYYNVLFAGESAEASQPFQIPKGGLALTVLKMDDGKLLVITSTP